MLAYLQEECGFTEGECTCVLMYAFGSLSHLRESKEDENGPPNEKEEEENGDGGAKGRWQVKDAAKGLVAEGRQSSRFLAERVRRPSDLAPLLSKKGN